MFKRKASVKTAFASKWQIQTKQTFKGKGAVKPRNTQHFTTAIKELRQKCFENLTSLLVLL